MKTGQNIGLLNNSRFYVLVSTVILSIAVFCYLRIMVGDDQLLAIRTQQVFGFLCIVYWYVALIISPLGYVIGKPKLRHLAFARRAIGVSAFYFAVLHGAIALFGQLGGIGALGSLPDVFKWALLAGAIALTILGLMAATSFDVVVKKMTYRKWKWLHRFVYFAGVLVILHVWMIGTHMAYSGYQLAAVIALGVLLALEFFGLTRLLNRKYLKLSRSEAGAVFLTMWAIAMGIALALPMLVQNYHSRHTDHVGIVRGVE